MSRSAVFPRTSRSANGGSLFRRTYEAMLGSRERQARRYVNYHLLALDDASLDQLGYDRRTLEAQGSAQAPF
jgi:hypothetical protein